MSRFTRLYDDSPGVGVLLTGPKRRRGQSASVAVSLVEVHGAIDKNLIQGVQDRLAFQAEQLVKGVVDVDEWYEASAPLVRAVHYAAGLAAAGGVDAFNDAIRDMVETRVGEQLDYLRNFADELRSGKQALNGFVPVRARMYADAAFGTFEAIRRAGAQDDGYKQERRIIDPRAEHCDPCVEYAALGWQPIGTLPPIGDSPCKTRCRCTFEYRTGESGSFLQKPNGQMPTRGEPTLTTAGGVLAAEPPDEIAALSRYWRPQGTGWLHVDGTRIKKAASGAFKVLDRSGVDLGTFSTAAKAFRFVESGGRAE